MNVNPVVAKAVAGHAYTTKHLRIFVDKYGRTIGQIEPSEHLNGGSVQVLNVQGLSCFLVVYD